MSRGVSKTILIGNCGGDPETKFTAGGSAVTNITVATSESWKDKNTGQQQERVEWHKIVFFNRLAEIAGEYLKKGSQVYIEGQNRTRSWKDEATGKTMYMTEVVAKEMQMLDSRGDNQQQGQQQQGGSGIQQQNQQVQQGQRQQGQQQQGQQTVDFEEDLIHF